MERQWAYLWFVFPFIGGTLTLIYTTTSFGLVWSGSACFDYFRLASLSDFLASLRFRLLYFYRLFPLLTQDDDYDHDLLTTIDWLVSNRTDDIYGMESRSAYDDDDDDEAENLVWSVEKRMRRVVGWLLFR
jgi:hypothetical protein